MGYKSNNNVVYSCKFHVIWCVKYRRRLLTGPVEERLKEIVHEVCEERDAEIFEAECDADHIHVLLEVDPQYGIHRLVKQMKGRSSRHLRSEFAHIRSKLPSLWTNSYFVSSVGGAPLDVIKQYVEEQKTT